MRSVCQHRRKKRVTHRSVKINLILWILVSGILFLVNALTFPEHWWAFYPTVGWGISLLAQVFELRNVDHEDGKYRDGYLNAPNTKNELLHLKKETSSVWNDSEFV